jgi:hypothetical protein
MAHRDPSKQADGAVRERHAASDRDRATRLPPRALEARRPLANLPQSVVTIIDKSFARGR